MAEIPPVSDIFPVLPLRDIVVFPHMIVPLFVGREDMAYPVRAFEELVVDIEYRAARIAEDRVHAVLDKGLDEYARAGNFHLHVPLSA